MDRPGLAVRVGPDPAVCLARPCGMDGLARARADAGAAGAHLVRCPARPRRAVGPAAARPPPPRPRHALSLGALGDNRHDNDQLSSHPGCRELAAAAICFLDHLCRGAGAVALGPERMTASAYDRIYAVVRRIPPGRVATYGQVAELAGIPGRARQVGYALHALPDSSAVPWQRVLNARGRVSLPPGSRSALEQRLLLEREGVHFDQ